MQLTFKQAQYAEKFKDPRWQQVRLQVFQRDGFRCQHCSSETKQLHAHHLYYIRGRDPWAYPVGSIITLCMDCHEYETKGDGDSWTPNTPRNWEIIFETGILNSGYEMDFTEVFCLWRKKSGLTTDKLVYELMLSMNCSIAHCETDPAEKGKKQ